jgi:hypothetical protein
MSMAAGEFTRRLLPAELVAGNDMRMRCAVLEQFWPSRRKDAFDQFCS